MKTHGLKLVESFQLYTLLRYVNISGTVLLVMSVAFASTFQYTDVFGAPPQEAVTQGGGAQSPPGGGRPDAQKPQLGSGNRGSAQRGSAGPSSVDPSTVRSEVTGPAHVIGEVLKIDGDSYVIRDKEGNEVILKVDPSTDMDGLINMGAKVAADVEVNGRVSRLKPVP